MKILYFMDAMHFGGAAKKTTTIANELSHRGHQVSFVTDTNYKVGYPLESSINVIPLYEKEQSNTNRASKVIRKLKRVRNIVTIANPDVVISVLPHVSFYVKMALWGIKIPVVFSDETSFSRKDSCFVHFIRHRFYNLADAVVVLTENDVKLLGKNIPKKVAIHNPVACPVYNGDFEFKKKTVLAIGSLKEWDIKGFDLLFRAFAKVSNKYPDWIITIAGDNKEPYKTKVMELISEAGLNSRVVFLGYRPAIFDIMAESSVYALSSRVEGFSLALVEAISQGCACVAFENHGVIDEVSCGGKGVLMVKDGNVDAFAGALDRLMDNESLRRQMAEDGLECVKEYSVRAIVDKWETVISKVVSK